VAVKSVRRNNQRPLRRFFVRGVSFKFISIPVLFGPIQRHWLDTGFLIQSKTFHSAKSPGNRLKPVRYPERG